MFTIVTSAAVGEVLGEGLVAVSFPDGGDLLLRYRDGRVFFFSRVAPGTRLEAPVAEVLEHPGRILAEYAPIANRDDIVPLSPPPPPPVEEDDMDFTKLRLTTLRHPSHLTIGSADPYPVDMGTPPGRDELFVSQVGSSTDLSQLVVELQESTDPSTGWTKLDLTGQRTVTWFGSSGVSPFTQVPASEPPPVDDPADGRVRHTSGNTSWTGVVRRTKRYVRYHIVSVNEEADVVAEAGLLGSV